MSHKTSQCLFKDWGKRGQSIFPDSRLLTSSRERRSQHPSRSLVFSITYNNSWLQSYPPLLTSPDIRYCEFMKSSIPWLTLLFVRNYSRIPSFLPILNKFGMYSSKNFAMITSDMQMHDLYNRKPKETKEPLDESERGE